MRRFKPIWALILFGIFTLSLAVRLYGSLTIGAELDGPGTFSIINYDEGGSCRAVLGDFPYPTFLGHQVITIARLLGHGPPPLAFGGHRGKSYCQSRPLIVIERAYSAVTGALTVVLIGLIALMMWPTRPQIAWTASTLLAFSNFHVAQSHSGTADAPQVFFIYLFTTVLVYGLVSKRKWPLFLSPLFLVGAIWAKLYVFAAFAYLALVPQIDSKRKAWACLAALVGALALAVLLIGWNTITEVIAHRRVLFWGGGYETSGFGTGYGNIGTWRRWIRNSVNLPVVLIVGLGLPACLFLWNGFKHALVERKNRLLWAVHAPAFAYASYMLVIGPVTYYRYYLPLFPTAALLVAYGLWESRWSTRKLFLAFFFVYPLLLTVDSEYNYRADPRRRLRSWYAERLDPRVYATYYVVPPKSAKNTGILNMEGYVRYGERYLGQVEYVILSENWYDTSFPNELNGPIAWNPEWLIKTRSEYAVAYRKILSNQDPNLELDVELNLRPVMPEFVVHKRLYGSFQLFLGDLRIYRVVRSRASPAIGP